ncbi:uncharacterized protein [Primulina eburnea]|uniref:uncharacterized protein n=1 Tax=Primulina eburnea TaxID=1245227 RepID=UPI003C6C87C6
MDVDAREVVQSSEGFQRRVIFFHSQTSFFKYVRASFPFNQWGLDIMGTFPISRAQKKFILVAVEYFSKWAEVESLAKITENEVLKFLWKNTFCRFGLPRKLISNNDRQFERKKIMAWCREMKITQSFALVTYPQANGKTKVNNRVIIQALKARLQDI